LLVKGDDDLLGFSYEAEPLIDDENETLGNLLSTYITYDENVFFCGYIIEHPLKRNVLLKIKLKNDNNLENVLLIIEKNIDHINTILNSIQKEVETQN
jgi:DNA-directed RNA polymerase subunit L